MIMCDLSTLTMILTIHAFNNNTNLIIILNSIIYNIITKPMVPFKVRPTNPYAIAFWFTSDFLRFNYPSIHRVSDNKKNKSKQKQQGAYTLYEEREKMFLNPPRGPYISRGI